MNMLIQRTGSAEFPDKLKVMISGDPKSGKTSLLGTVPNIIVADTEFRANNLQSIAHLNVPYVQVDSTMKLNNLRMILANDGYRAQQAQALGMQTIEAVAIDTVDTLQKLMKAERRAENRGKWDRDDWGWIKEEMIKVVEAYTALPLHVFLLVHTKTETIGKGDDAYQIVLPGLEGSIAREIAGMVGYSLRSFRQEVVKPDGSKQMTYLLQTEGDETYGYLGNRAAGSLPTVIEPTFQTIYANAMAHRPQQAPQAVEAVTLSPQQQQMVTPPLAQQQAQANAQNQPFDVRAAAQQQQNPASPPAPAPSAQPAPAQGAVQTPVQGNADVPAQAQPQAANPTPDRPADGEPLTAAAMQHIKRVYDAIGQTFPEQKIQALNLGQGRAIVMMWQAAQQDAAEGKLPEGSTPVHEMVQYLQQLDLVGEPAAAPEPPKEVAPKVDGTIDEVKAYIAGDLGKVQEAYDLEVAKPKPRTSLVSYLLDQGAKPPAPVQTDVQNAAPQTAPQPTPAPADAPPVTGAEVRDPEAQQGVAVVAEATGPVEVLSSETRADRPCQKCGNPIDDEDIARLSEGRFGEWLCVQDYIARTKA